MMTKRPVLLTHTSLLFDSLLVIELIREFLIFFTIFSITMISKQHQIDRYLKNKNI